ncbi:MAG: DUF4037 domain-containing protein [Erysipelotrichaceae bacterium]|nr:DUF4037 domain-containing protein [Erysipelotrichaceae bacterium]
MNGIDLSREYYELYGKPMLEEQFPELLPLIACGVCGSGSESFGYDDEISRDHDYEPGFIIFLPGEDLVDRRSAFLLERAYAKLPKEYKGLKRSLMAPAGGRRRGVKRTAEFFVDKCGAPDGVLNTVQWLRVPEHALAEAVNGELFSDSCGEVTRIRERLAFWPEDIARKKLAGAVYLMGQAGEYNYPRCLAHGETGAAQLAVQEFVDCAMEAVFLLNRKYRPYYKWRFRALRQLSALVEEAARFEYLLTTDNGQAAEEKQKVIQGITEDILKEIQRQGWVPDCRDAGTCAMKLNDSVQDAQIRSLHILAAH